MPGRDTRVYLQKMKIQGDCLKMRMNTQAKPSKIQGGELETLHFPASTKSEYNGSPYVYSSSLNTRGASPKIETSIGLLEDGPHQVLCQDSAHDTPLRNLIHDHGVEDRLHHLGDVRVLSIPRSHAKVKTQTEDEVILREGPRTLGRGLPQQPSKDFLNVFSLHLGASEIQKVNHLFLLSLSTLKDWRMGRR
ncbi:hypothetical protein Cgig2_017139 [Carnegiea gigantea]|uniref:Uncharacterized protein n=1 Tax=Carnegiea gigantea TaxID=171969 RepID=A0A9Q1Q4K2_9CARY|nr:hypothetical protein Cgig2_017139 [Carnegiea gigantea]